MLLVALDPQVARFLEQIDAQGQPPLETVPLEQSRAMLSGLTSLGGDPPRRAATQERAVPGPAGPIPVRLYRPDAGGGGVPPLVMFFHGGGFVLGGLDSHDAVCHRLSAAAAVVVAAVDYRLAPEHPFPAAVEDCVAASAWCVAHAAELGADGGRVAVVGDSAGGNLAAVVSRKARDGAGPPVAFQVLIYPCTDLTGSWPSRSENGEGYLLTARDMRFFEDAYCRRADRKDPDLSPLYTADLSGLPPALVVTAEFDPLRDEGEAYAGALRKAGVAVTLSRYDGMVHGFYGLDALIDRAAEAGAEVARALRDALGPPCRA